MFSKPKVSYFVAAALSSAASFSTFAASDNTGWFVGGTISAAQADFTERNVESDETSLMISPYAGYNVSERFGIDGQFHFGEYGDNGVGVFSITPRVNFTLAPDFSLFIRGGIASIALVDEDDDDEVISGVVPTIGFGGRLDITDKVKVNFAYDYSTGELEYQEDSVFDGLEVDIDQSIASMSVYYQF